MGAPSTAALTDDGGWPPDPRANEGPVPGATTWDGRLSESSSRLASIIAHRKGYSSAHDSSITAAASASPSPGQLNQPIKDNQNRVEQPRSIPAPGHGHPGVRVEKVRHDDDGIAQAGGITPTALFPVTPPTRRRVTSSLRTCLRPRQVTTLSRPSPLRNPKRSLQHRSQPVLALSLIHI